MTEGVLVGAVLLGLIPAFLARRKGLGFWTYWLFGAALFVVALPVVLLAKDRRRRCGHCDELVRSAATICPHCRRELAPAA